MTRVRKMPPRLDVELWNKLVEDYVSRTDSNSGSINVDKGLYRTVAGGNTSDPYSGFLTSQLSNVWFLRSGYGSGYDDIVLRRYGSLALDIYNITDARNVFSIDTDGKIVTRSMIEGISNIIPIFANVTPISTVPGTVYSHIASDLDINLRINAFKSTISRIDITVKGSGTGTKYIRVFDFKNSISFGEYSWSDSNKHNTISSWNTLDLSGVTTTDFQIGIQCKSSDSSETIEVYKVFLQLQEMK